MAGSGSPASVLDASALLAHLNGATVSVKPVTDADCVAAARLRSATKEKGLSLADRACLALAGRLDVPAVTVDRDWADVELGAEIQLIR